MTDMTDVAPGAPAIGAGIERVEDLRLLRGRGSYLDDLARPGLLHAAILRSAVAHGRLRSMDASAAVKLPGVHAVYTAEDIRRETNGAMPIIPMRQEALPELKPFEQPVIAEGKVRYVGE